MPPPLPAAHPTFREAFRFWLKLGLVSFGGPAGQIAIMQGELVEKRRWISQARFLHALNYCMLLPGPEAQQLAIYIGWLLHDTAGGVVAGSLFVLPSMFLLWGLSCVYAMFGGVPWIAAIFYGLKPVVLAIVAAAVIRVGRKALKNEALWAIAALAFAAIFLGRVPFPAVVLAAGLLGFAGGKVWPAKFTPAAHGPAAAEAAVLDDRDAAPAHAAPSRARALRVCAAGLALWWGPLLAVALTLGADSTIFREGLFFSKAAVVTFGGAYAVLPYVAQRAVGHFGWLGTGQMMDGLGLAETTPGPLIMVLQFVGFLGAWNHPGHLPPLLAATLGALVTTWVTFTPCFLWVFLGAPHIEALRGNQTLHAALSAITAAVVGVMVNLAAWFALHVLRPALGVTDWFALALGAVALAGMVRWKWDAIPVVLGGGVAGLVVKMLV